MSELERALRELFEEDSDTALTTEDSSPEEEEIEKAPVMSTDLADALMELSCLTQKFLVVQLQVKDWDEDTVGMSEVADAKSRMVEFRSKHEVLFDKIFRLCGDVAKFNKSRADLDTCGKSITTCLISIDTVLRNREAAASGGAGSGPLTTVNLPKLEVPTFDGKVECWVSFRDLFTASVKNHKGLSEAQKLQYLMSSVKGEAENIVKGFSITDGNFKKAWSLLERRYDNTREIIFILLRKFFHQSACTKECPKSLKKLIDTSMEVVRSLEDLTNPDDWDDVLVFTLMEKMDPDTRRDWSKSLSGTAMPTFEEVSSIIY